MYTNHCFNLPGTTIRSSAGTMCLLTEQPKLRKEECGEQSRKATRIRARQGTLSGWVPGTRRNAVYGLDWEAKLFQFQSKAAWNPKVLHHGGVPCLNYASGIERNSTANVSFSLLPSSVARSGGIVAGTSLTLPAQLDRESGTWQSNQLGLPRFNWTAKPRLLRK